MKAVIALVVLLLAFQCTLGQKRSHIRQAHIEVAAAVAPDWPEGKISIGKQEVRVTVTTDGYFGNVVAAESIGQKSVFSAASEAAARLWKFFPAKPNSKQTLTFVFEVFPKTDYTRRAMTTFIPPYKVLIERPAAE